MDSIGWKYSAFRNFSLILFVSIIDCGDDTYLRYRTGRFRDISQAVTFMKENLPLHVSNEELCKKYAILSNKSLNERFPMESTVLEVARMGVGELDRQYNELSIDRMIYAYMSVIDRYRVTKLAPPMLDIVECLKQIDTPVVQAYLSNEELLVILDLYKQVLGLPGTKIDIKSLDMTKFHQPFWDTLRNHFSEYFDVDAIFSDSVIRSMNPSNVVGPQLQKDHLDEGIQKSQKRQAKNRRREHSRLTQQRLRLMYPDTVRQYQGERRRLRKELEQSLLSQSDTTPDKVEAMRLMNERRKRRNEQRQLRLKQLRDQREHQRRLLESTSARAEQFNEILKLQIRQEQYYRDPERERTHLSVSRLQLLPLLRVPSKLVDIEQQVQPSAQAYVDPNTISPKFIQPRNPPETFSQHPDQRPSNIEVQNYGQIFSHYPVPDSDIQRCRQSYGIIDTSISERKRWEDFMAAGPSYGPRFREDIKSPSDAIMQFLLDEPQSDPEIANPPTDNPDNTTST